MLKQCPICRAEYHEKRRCCPVCHAEHIYKRTYYDGNIQIVVAKGAVRAEDYHLRRFKFTLAEENA